MADSGATSVADTTTVPGTGTEPPFGAATPAGTGRREWLVRIPRPAPPTAPVYVALVLLVLAIVAVLVVVRVRAAQDLGTARSDVLVVASRQVNTLTTASPVDSQAQLKTLLANSTGALKADIARYASSFSSAFTKSATTTRGTVAGAGVVSLTRSHAVVLVAVDVAITSRSAADRSQGYRWQVTLDRRGDRWLVSGLNDVTSTAVAP